MKVVTGYDESFDVATGVTVRTPVMRDFDELRAERVNQLQVEVDAFVAARMSQKERDAMSMIAAGLDEIRAYLRPLTKVEKSVRVDLVHARQWIVSAISLIAQARMHCAACTTVEELAAVVVDYSALGPAPTITAGELTLILGGG
jgi:hypothetical protein